MNGLLDETIAEPPLVVVKPRFHGTERYAEMVEKGHILSALLAFLNTRWITTFVLHEEDPSPNDRTIAPVSHSREGPATFQAEGAVGHMRIRLSVSGQYLQ